MARVKRMISNFPEYSLGLLASALIALVFLEVICRYFLKYPVAWSEEGARFLFIWLSFLGAAVSCKRMTHFSFEMIVLRLPIKARSCLSIINLVIIITLSIVLVVQGLNLLKAVQHQKHLILGFSTIWSHIAIPISGALMFIYTIKQLIEQIRGLFLASEEASLRQDKEA